MVLLCKGVEELLQALLGLEAVPPVCADDDTHFGWVWADPWGWLCCFSGVTRCILAVWMGASGQGAEAQCEQGE